MLGRRLRLCPAKDASRRLAGIRRRWVSALIGDPERGAQVLECDIAAEEKRAGVFNRSDAAYPIAARILAVRWDN